MFPETLRDRASAILDRARADGLHLATAESCTGGLIAALFTDIAGSSDVIDRGFVTYSYESKSELLGVAMPLIVKDGAVSKEVAAAMATGALAHSNADIAVAVTGIAGPGGGTAEKPVGLVHMAAARKGRPVLHEEHRFGDIGRSQVRLATVEAALALLQRLL